MYQRKHHKRSHRRSAALLVSLLLLLTVTVGGTIAFLMDSDGPLHNLFNPSKVTTYVDETLDGATKINVKIQNTGDTEAYIRAAVVVTWQDEEGNVYGSLPEADTDYTILFNTDEQTNPNGKWTLAEDGFYYWSAPVAANGGQTGILISKCELNENVPAPADGYYLNVEIIGSGIQSLPTSVVTTEWNSGVNGIIEKDGINTLSIKEKQ